MDKVTRQCPQTTTFLKRKENQSGIEPSSFRLPAQRHTARPNRLIAKRITNGPIYIIHNYRSMALALALSGSHQGESNCSLDLLVTPRCRGGGGGGE